jgi:hypothetical protein
VIKEEVGVIETGRGEEECDYQNFVEMGQDSLQGRAFMTTVMDHRIL